MNKELIERLLYKEEKNEVLKVIDEIKDEITLFVFAYNYNWDNGFGIPSKILENKNCTLSVALLLFYSADGLNYLMDKRANDNLPNWSEFIEILYKKIIGNKFMTGTVAYEIPLTKIQLFKLSKILSTKEEIFVNNIMGEKGCILL